MLCYPSVSLLSSFNMVEAGFSSDSCPSFRSGIDIAELFSCIFMSWPCVPRLWLLTSPEISLFLTDAIVSSCLDVYGLILLKMGTGPYPVDYDMRTGLAIEFSLEGSRVWKASDDDVCIILIGVLALTKLFYESIIRSAFSSYFDFWLPSTFSCWLSDFFVSFFV